MTTTRAIRRRLVIGSIFLLFTAVVVTVTVPQFRATAAWHLSYQDYALRTAESELVANPDANWARLFLARAAWEQRHPARAVQVLGDLFPDQLAFEDLIQHGWALIDPTRMSEAIAFWEWLNQRFPGHADVLTGLCSVYYMAGSDAAAETHAEELVSNHPAYTPFGQLILALIYQDSRRHLDALEMFRKASQHWDTISTLCPNYDLIHAKTKFAEIAVRVGAYEEAITQADYLLKDRPNDVSALLIRGESYRQTGQFQKALSDLERAVELAPHESLTLMHLGLTLNEMGEYKKAIPPLQRAVNANPSVAKIHYALGQALLHNGQPDIANHHLKTAMLLKETE